MLGEPGVRAFRRERPDARHESGQQRQGRRPAEYGRPHLDGRVGEAGAQQQGAVGAGGARGGDAVRAGVDQGAGQCRIVGVDDQSVPVLAHQDDPAPGRQHPAGLGQRPFRLGEFMEHLVGTVAVRRGVRQRQRVGVPEPDVRAGPPRPRGGDHPLVGVDPGRPHASAGQLGDRPSTTAADVHDPGAGRGAEQVVGVRAQGGGARPSVGRVEPGEEGGMGRVAGFVGHGGQAAT
ncbi:hypothetical protein JCM4814A_90750 [Streptomyces phaeofaciens JCM 4814]|uniref:Uncharacterized protein n=1 Tax=Streptomyces phaeofaciens TaxID=68254 RepID=A0A918HC14_9ACTN|nr:hypothetical protein GCM10010226_30780 [Streptomyces phaeofaciens]